jgi:hypothetical protein
MEDNKDYILNIRVSKETYEKLKAKARENSESLSTLVRKTLDDSWEILTDLKQELFGGSNKNNGGIMYYQKIIVAKDFPCDSCHVNIPKGSQAFLGETKSGPKKYFCQSCFVEN